MKNPLIVALEQEQESVIESTPLEQSELETDQAVAEVVEEQNEIEVLNDGAESAVNDVETLGEIQDAMAESLEEGEGISEDAARVVEIAVESIGRRLGVDMSSTIPSLESFSGSNSRRHSTRIALESLGDRIRKIWEAIKNGLKMMMQKIKDFFAKFFSNAEKVRKQAEALKKVARERTTWKAVNKEVKVGSSTISALSVDGSFKDNALDTMIKNHASAVNDIRGFSQTISALAGEFSKLMDSAKNKGEVDASGVENTTNKIKDTLFKGVQVVEDKEYAVEEKDGVTESRAFKAGPFVGGDYLVLTTYLKKNIPHVNLSVVQGKKNSANTLTALDSGDIIKRCDDVISLMKLTEDYKKVQGEIATLNKNLVNLAEQAIKTANSAMDSSEDGGGQFGRVVASLSAPVSKVGNLSSRVITMIPSWNVKLGNSLLKYASASLNNLKDD